MEKKGFECLDFLLFPVKCLTKFGSAMTQRSEVALKPLLCLKMKSKQGRNLSELQLYAVIETKTKKINRAAPAATAAVLGGAQWKGSCSTTLQFWSNQFSAAGVGKKTVIPEFHAEVNTGSDVTFAVHFSPFEAGSLLYPCWELNKGTQRVHKGENAP